MVKDRSVIMFQVWSQEGCRHRVTGGSKWLTTDQ